MTRHLSVSQWSEGTTGADLIAAVRRLEELGYHECWHPEVFGRETLTTCAYLLAKTVKFMLAAALLMPMFNAMLGLGAASLLGLSEGDALLFVVLAASASYIAVPAAMRLVLPEANPGLYLTMSLAITFPLNVLVGIPVYHALIRWLL